MKQPEGIMALAIGVVLVLNGYVIASIVVLILLKCTQTGIVSDHVKETGRPNETIFAMLVFWFFGAALDSMEVFYTIVCAGEFIANGHTYVFAVVVDVAYHLIRPIYKLVLVIFCLVFKKAIFDDRVRVGLMIILATMFSIWIELLFDEAHHSAGHGGNGTQEHEDIWGNDSMVNINNDSISYCNDSKVHKDLELGRSICVPSMIEFTLLAVECVVHWFRRCRSRTDNHPVPRPDSEVMTNPPEGVRPNRSCCGFGSELCGECHQYLNSDRYKYRKLRRYCSNFVYAFSYPLNVALSVCFVVSAWIASEQSTENVRIFHCIYSIIWYSCNIGMTFSALAVSRYFEPKHGTYKNLNGLEHLLLLALLGPIIMHSFDLISIFHQWISSDYPNFIHPWWYITRELFNTFQILIQVPLIFLARRITTEPSVTCCYIPAGDQRVPNDSFSHDANRSRSEQVLIPSNAITSHCAYCYNSIRRFVYFHD